MVDRYSWRLYFSRVGLAFIQERSPQLKTAYSKKEGILWLKFINWTPEWIHFTYDLRQLEELSAYGILLWLSRSAGDSKKKPT